MELNDIFQAQRQLSEKDLIIYNAELQKKTKSVGLAYCLLIFFGGLGLHKFYLGKIGEGIAYLVVGTIDFILLQAIIFNADSQLTTVVHILLWVSATFLLYDLFTLSEQISQQEQTLRIELLKQFGIVVENVNKQVSVFESISKVFSENPKKVALWFFTSITFLVAIKIVTFIQEEQVRKEVIKAEQAEQARKKAEEQARKAEVERQVENKRQEKIKLLSEIIDNKNGTVTFKSTGLTWQKCSVGQTWAGETCSGNATEMSWNEAMKISVNFAGHNDWRLPTKEELLALVFCSDEKYDLDGSCKNMTDVPTINSTYFPNTQSSKYWSSYADLNSSAWNVNFYNGYSGYNDKEYGYFVRLVR